MALNPSQLQTDLQAVFANPSITPATLGGQWGTAFTTYATGIVPVSTTVAAAGTTLASSLASVFSSQGSASSKASAMESAFLTWATSVGAGMVGYVPTPPSGLIGFLAEMSKDPEDWATTHAAAALLWKNKFHAWMTTGFSTLIALPNTVVPWS
jgi:hypothetical protein